MAIVRVPTNVSSITFADSGIKTPVGGMVSGITPQEANAITGASFGGGYNAKEGATLVSTDASGNLQISLPVVVTSITINAVVYAVTGADTPWGKLLNAAVPAPAASIFLYQNFALVQG